MAVPGLKVVAPSTPADVKGLLAAAVREDVLARFGVTLEQEPVALP